MTQGIAMALGGLGLFLLGMIVLTEGLRAIAGGALANALARFTRTPVSGAATGAVTTALIQSSSATTVAAVGFVGAGILSFPQALGVIFGANLGTTATGWMVALLGFKLQLGLAVLPLILVGSLLRLFGRGRVAATGMALAGFGLVFVGIDALREGMLAFQGLVTPASLPSDTWLGRLLLVGFGVALTIVTQSSSAGVAMTLAAIHAGTIEFSQAAAMVIGMDVGTTATAALATVGGSTPARRTGFAHVLYNLLTAVAAYFLLGPFVAVCGALAPGFVAGDPEIALVAFHTFFNSVGVLGALSVSGAFAALVIRLIPDRPSPFTRRLDPRLLPEPAIAIQAVLPTLEDLTRQTFDVVDTQLASAQPADAQRLDLIELALDETRGYLQRMQATPDQPAVWQRHVSALHVLDHLDRLVSRARRGKPRLGEIERSVAELRERLLRVKSGLGQPEISRLEAEARRAWEELEKSREDARRERVEQAARGALAADRALEQLEALRHVRRVAYHTWRILHHLRRCHWSGAVEGAEPADLGREIDVLEPE